MIKETKQIIVFVALAYFLTWIVMGLQMLIDNGMNNIFLITLSVLGPGAAALIICSRTIGIKVFFKHSFDFKIRPLYWLIFLAFVAWRYFLVMFVGVRVEGSSLILPILLIPVAILTGGAEEFGWRFVQPKLENKMNIVVATLIFSLIWWIWHLPLYIIPGVRPDSISGLIGFFIFLGFTFTNAFTLASIYKITNSVLLCVFFHAWSNAVTNTFMPTGDLKTILGFAFEGIVSMTILILCGKGMIKVAKVRKY